MFSSILKVSLIFIHTRFTSLIYEIYIWFIEDRFTINNFVTGVLLSNVYEHLGHKSFSLVNTPIQTRCNFEHYQNLLMLTCVCKELNIF